MRLGFHLLTNANCTIIKAPPSNDSESIKRKLDSLDEVVRSIEGSRCSALYTFQFFVHLYSLELQREVKVDVCISSATNTIYQSFLNSMGLREPKSVTI